MQEEIDLVEYLAHKTHVRPKIKDGIHLNLYVDKRIVALLDAMSTLKGLSRSQLVESLVREQSGEGGNERLRRRPKGT